MEIGTSDTLTFKCWSEGHRNVYFRNTDLQSPGLDGFLADFIMCDIGYDMLVGLVASPYPVEPPMTRTFAGN